MAHIVKFRVAGARVEETPSHRPTDHPSAHAGGAQIVIFPGVRRERHAEPAPDAEGGRSASDRDWLELRDDLPATRP